MWSFVGVSVHVLIKDSCLWYGVWWVWSLVGVSVHVLIKDSDSLVLGVVGVVTCGCVSACPDQGL